MPNYKLCRHDIKRVRISTILDLVYSNFLETTKFSRNDKECFAVLLKSYSMNHFFIDKSSPPEVFLGRDVLKIYSEFIGEHPCRSHYSLWLSFCKFAPFSEYLYLRTPLKGCFCVENLTICPPNLNQSTYKKYLIGTIFNSWNVFCTLGPLALLCNVRTTLENYCLH